MIAVDTSIWIEFLKGSEAVFEIFKFEMKRNGILAIEPVFGELLQGALNKREIETIKKYWANLPHAEVSDLWILAGEYAAKHKTYAKGVGLIDVSILVAAKTYDAKIWTLDKKLKSIVSENLLATYS